MAPQDTGISFQRWGYVFWVQGKFLFIAPYPTLARGSILSPGPTVRHLELSRVNSVRLRYMELHP